MDGRFLPNIGQRELDSEQKYGSSIKTQTRSFLGYDAENNAILYANFKANSNL